MNNEVEAYERSKLDKSEEDQYRFPRWYGDTFLWLVPWVVVGALVLAVQSEYGNMGEAVAWWIGLLVFTGLFVKFFQRLS